MFFGEYSHQIDAKNRIRIPSRLKSELNEEYVFCKGTTKCIIIYPKSELENIKQDFLKLNKFDVEEQTSAMEMFASIFPGIEDGQGRVVLPEKLRSYAGLNGDEKDIVIVGVVNRIEIYAKSERERIANEMSYQDRLKILADRTEK